MKRRFLVMATIISLSLGGILTACGNFAGETKQVSAESASVGQSEAQTASAKPVEQEASENQDAEGKYSAFTDESNAEVEAYADKVVEAVLAKDWNAVGDMIAYPIGSEEGHTLRNNKEEFLDYANDTGFDDEMLDLLKKAGF